MNTQIRADDHERERLIGVQYLRALAALQVVVYHSSVEADRLILLGNFGVPLFFVVSGFIMMVVTERECSPFAFLRRPPFHALAHAPRRDAGNVGVHARPRRDGHGGAEEPARSLEHLGCPPSANWPPR